MTRTIHCEKLKKEAEGLGFVPHPGELGQKIYNSISKEAWEMWQQRQTMFINENRLNLMDPAARKFLENEMEKFLFTAEDTIPEGYVAPKKD